MTITREDLLNKMSVAAASKPFQGENDAAFCRRQAKTALLVIAHAGCVVVPCIAIEAGVQLYTHLRLNDLAKQL